MRPKDRQRLEQAVGVRFREHAKARAELLIGVLEDWNKGRDGRMMSGQLKVQPKDRQRLEQAAGLYFRDDGDAEQMIESVKWWYKNRKNKMPPMLKKHLKLRKQARAVGATVVSPALAIYDLSPIRGMTERQYASHVLTMCVSEILNIWRLNGGETVGSYYNDTKGEHDGPVIRLMFELFKQASVPEQSRPSPHALHDAIQEFKAHSVRDYWTERLFPPPKS